jgi:Fe-S oxidoreductase
LSHIVKSAAGIDQNRTLPLFAPQTFRTGFRSRSQARAGAPQVLLWTDTFNNHFHPETAQAAVEVLERAGFQVDIPRRQLCCGRPLYEFGMLDSARQRLQAIVQELAPQIDAQTPVLVLEPACASVFRDELPHLLEGDERAQRLARQTYLLDEFVCDHRDRFQDFPKLSGRALVHAHCHHKVLRQENAGHGPLEMLGMDVNVLESGCCGMAGSFGFDAAKVEVAHTIGELVLLPAVREAADADWIVADGFSCREQIAQYTERRAIHPVQAMAMAVRSEQPRAVPEAAIEARRARAQQRLATRTALAAGALAIGVLAAWCARGTRSA